MFEKEKSSESSGFQNKTVNLFYLPVNSLDVAESYGTIDDMKSPVVLVAVVLITTLRTSISVKVVVIRENSSSKSVEESEEQSSDGDSSEEIDLLLDLIKKENSDRKSQSAAKTIKVIRRKPNSKEIISQPTVRKESFHKPKEHKEYHVHYHNHQHKNPDNPSLKFDEDKMRPMLWDSFSSLEDFREYEPYMRAPKIPMVLPHHGNEKLRNFKDFESLWRTKLASSPSSSEYFLGDTSHELFKDFNSAMESELMAKKLISDRNRMLMKKYQALLNMDARASKLSFPAKVHPSYDLKHQEDRSSKRTAHSENQRPNSQKDSFPNRDRFAGFTDFSSIESPQPKNNHKGNHQHTNNDGDEEDDLSIRDFAIVIKTRQRSPTRPSQLKDFHQNDRQVGHRQGIMVVPQKSQSVPSKTLRPVNVPRLLDAPGGTPLQLEKQNQMKQNIETLNSLQDNFLQHMKAVESGSRLVRVQPLQRPNMLSSKIYNGWLFKRLQR